MNIREKAQTYTWCGETLELLRCELDAVIEAQLAIPTEPGGWWHQYVCPKHHTELLFNPLQDDNGIYRCPYGCEQSGEPYRGAWLVFRHQAMARYALQSAAVYAGYGEAKYAELGKQIVLQYAAQFPLYPVHPDAQPWMLKGRAFHQALTEAIWATTLLRAYLLLVDEGISFEDAGSDFSTFLMLLETSMEQYHHILTVDRDNPENNYTAWLNAALCGVYAVNGDAGKAEKLLELKGGIRLHLSIAVQPDGLEFEGSVYYHVFVLRAYMIAAEMLNRFGIDAYGFRGDQSQSMESMLDVLVKLADDSGRLPALHDGPYERIPYAREIAEVFEIGYARYRKPQYLNILNEVYRSIRALEGLGGDSCGGRSAASAGRIGSLEAVLYGTGAWDGSGGLADESDETDASFSQATAQENAPESLVLNESGFAMLRHPGNPVACLLDFGPHGGSHGHFDKLNLMMHIGGQPLSPDRGTVPYGSELKKRWYPETACHNTVSINGKSQLAAEGECTAFHSTPSYASISLGVDGAYEAASLARHVLVTDDLVLDWYQIRMEEAGQIDWWFHFCGQLAHESQPWQEADGAEALGVEAGYGYITPLRSMTAAASASEGDSGTLQTDLLIRQRADGGLTEDNDISAALLTSAGAVFTHVSSPGLASDPSVPMEGVFVRESGRASDIVAVYRTDGKPATLARSNEQLIVDDGHVKRIYVLTEKGLKELT